MTRPVCPVCLDRGFLDGPKPVLCPGDRCVARYDQRARDKITSDRQNRYRGVA